jgi:hypothetical protein
VMAVSTVVLLCGVQLAAGRAGTVPYDTAPMAAAVQRALRDGHPVAMVGAYNGEYHFEGRLQDAHIDVIAKSDAVQWLHDHATGLLLRYDRGRDAPVPAGVVVARHPFRNGWATLSSAAPGAQTVSEPPDRTE